MKKRTIYFRILILLAIILSGCNQETNQEQDDIAALQAIFDQYASSVAKNDLEGIMSLWEDDGIRSVPGITSIIGKENIRTNFEELFNSPFNYEIIPLGEGIVEVCGDFAFSFATKTIVSTPKEGGEAVPQDANVLTVLRRQPDNSWKIYIDHVNFHPTWSMDTIPSDLTKENPYYR